MKHAWRMLAAAGAVVLSLSGCQTVNQSLTSVFTNKPVEYETATSRKPLEVPPELDPIANNERYVIPDRPKVVSASTEEARARQEAEARGDAPAEVLPETEFASVEVEGNIRYVHVKATPEQVWPLMLDFWPKNGLAIKSQDSRTGVVTTEWAENKANLPKDIIRGTIGKVLDFVYDTGTRDQYRSRMERDEQGNTNIFITHRQMVEVLKGKQEDSTIWQPAPSDPELEAVFLTKMAQSLEYELNPTAKTVEEKADLKLAEIKFAPIAQVVNDANGQPAYVVIEEPFDRAWRRVSLALDRAGFDVTDRDREQGLFVVQYLDPDYEAQKKSEQGMFANWFSKADPIDPVQYNVRLSQDGENSRLTVALPEGASEGGEVIPRIVKLLGEQIR